MIINTIQISSISVLLGACIVALLAVLVVLYEFATRRLPKSDGWARAAFAAIGAVGCAATYHEFHLAPQNVTGDPAAFSLANLLFVALVGVGCALFGSIDGWMRPGRSTVGQPIAWAFVLVMSGLGSWSFAQLERLNRGVPLMAIDPIALGELRTLPNLYGVTDLGRPIELSRWVSKDEDATFETLQIPGPLHGGMQRGEATEDTNCHGWIFTGGRHFLSGRMVDRILDDNGYHIVSDPEPNDVVVYRNAQQEVLHTALVRGRLNDGLVIVESKFGVGARFLHLPEDQPYSPRFEFYRTDRGRHDIAIRNGTPGDVTRRRTDGRSATLRSPSTVDRPFDLRPTGRNS